MTVPRKELLYRMLLGEKQRILAQIKASMEAGVEADVRMGFEVTQDNADKSIDELEKHIAAQITGVRSEMVDLIDDALNRLNEGTYGLCDDCGEEIPVERLMILPFVSRCVRCQEQADRLKKIEQEHVIEPPSENTYEDELLEE
ncbi:MAG: TraR/DksA family transcriptional regulator [Desulfobacterota bacterium]|nr:TraR/DksA family transcriptional regulator [Thermodesulfobacteriota bacterium]